MKMKFIILRSEKFKMQSVSLHLFYLWMFVISFCVTRCTGTFNLYMNTEEVKRILGLSKELYYVREGVVNAYALNFIVPIPAHITAIHFTWETLGQNPLPYSASIESSDTVALHKPTLDIPTNGSIPTEAETFQINLPCTGFRSTEVNIELTLNVTANPTFRANDITRIVLRRKKICLEGRPDPPVPSYHNRANINGHPSGRNTGSGSGSQKGVAGSYSGGIIGEGVRVGNGGVHVPISNKKVSKKGFMKNPQLNSMEEVLMISEEAQPNDTSQLIFIILASSLGLMLILISLTAALYFRVRKRTAASNGFIHVGTSGKGSSGSPCGSGIGTGSASGGSLFLRSESPHHYSSVSPCLGSGSYTYSSFLPNSHYMEISNSTIDSKSNSCKLADITVERCKVRLQSVIMEGTFAKLYKGTVQEGEGSEEKVIVKTVNDHSSPVQMALLLHEGLALVGMTHKNIYGVIGVAAEDRAPPFLIYPDDGFKNLKRYLVGCRSGAGSKGIITPQEIVHMAIQIASGIAFLHKKNVFHRDVATRNCLVDDNLMVKVSDGALSRDLFPEDYHWMGEAETRPVKWMPPESILQPRATSAADIWSFGVLLWELATLAQQPYLEIDHSDLFSFLKMGYRLSQPVNCPDELYSSMSRCWTWDPDDRPKWTHVIPELQSLHAQLDQYV